MKMPRCRTGSLMKSKICLPGRAPFSVILAIENGMFKIKREPRLCGGCYVNLALVLMRILVSFWEWY